MMKNKSNKKDDLNIKTLWKLFRSDKGKTYSFFIFYIIFFIFLFIFISGTNYKDNKVDNNNNIESSLPFKTINLENNDYKFKYIVDTNYNTIDYLGERNKNIINIKGDEGEYTYYYQNGVLINDSDKKIIHDKLLDIFEVKRIIKNSKLISETKLNENNNYIYNYKIKSNDLNNILLSDNLFDDLENDISVLTNQNKEIIKIEFDLLNYEKNLNSELNLFKIIIDYGENDE